LSGRGPERASMDSIRRTIGHTISLSPAWTDGRSWGQPTS
jgi:hypothetical protein